VAETIDGAGDEANKSVLYSACDPVLFMLQSLAVQMQRVHAELKGRMWGPWGHRCSGPVPPPTTADPTRLLQLWDYEGSLTIQVTVCCP